VARAVDYRSAGTVEFLLAPDGRFYFLEMNTRLQVEHPVTEWTTGIDLVAAQLRVARGERLGFAQRDVVFRGHAVEVRVCAEDPATGFLPSAGPLLAVREPVAPGVRVDSGIAAGMTVPMEYDPLLAKLSAYGASRVEAIRRLERAVRDTVILGPATNLGFLRDVLAHPAFLAGDTHTGFLDEHLPGWRREAAEVDVAAIIAALALEHLRPGRAIAGASAAAEPSAWETLGRWRLGT
jgi:acetyl/propionyl-CoA carboxylase alpha subunit